MNFYYLKVYFRDRVILAALVASGLFLAVQWWLAASSLRPGTEQIILHYTAILGPNLSGKWWQILFLPSAGALMLLVNLLVSLLLFGSEKTLARLVILAVPFLELGLLVGLWWLVVING